MESIIDCMVMVGLNIMTAAFNMVGHRGELPYPQDYRPSLTKYWKLGGSKKGVHLCMCGVCQSVGTWRS